MQLRFEEKESWSRHQIVCGQEIGGIPDARLVEVFLCVLYMSSIAGYPEEQTLRHYLYM